MAVSARFEYDAKPQFSARLEVVKPPKNPPEPPSFIDRNWNALEWLAENPIVRWVVGSSIWTWLFGRQRHAVAG